VHWSGGPKFGVWVRSPTTVYIKLLHSVTLNLALLLLAIFIRTMLKIHKLYIITAGIIVAVVRNLFVVNGYLIYDSCQCKTASMPYKP